MTMTVSGVPLGIRSGENANSCAARYIVIVARAAHPIHNPNCNCFLLMGEDLEALAYGGGCDNFRGGRAKCILAACAQVALDGFVGTLYLSICSVFLGRLDLLRKERAHFKQLYDLILEIATCLKGKHQS